MPRYAMAMAMSYRFADYVLDPVERRLSQERRPIELSGRYFDALHLLVSEAGKLVTKDRFMGDVWAGVPVTDEALTQCIRTLRRVLGDDAAAPRFIETVPKHGYRFVAPVDRFQPAPSPATGMPMGTQLLGDVAAAALGGGSAGLVGGAAYASSGLVSAGLGAASTMLAFMTLCLLLGVAGGGMVGLGISIGRKPWWRTVLGGTLGGLTIGLLSAIVGNDLFVMLFGRAPASFTGPLAAATVGLATGATVALAEAWGQRTKLALAAAVLAIGAIAGIAIPLAGGQLLAGSLAELVRAFPASPLQLDRLTGSGLTVATAFESSLFVGFVTAAFMLRRRLFDS